MGISKHTGGHPNMWGCPNIWGHLNIQGAFKHMGSSKCIGAYGQPLSLTTHAFFVLCIFNGVSKDHQNIQGGIQTYGECPNIQGASKHMWEGVQTYGASKHMGVQTYRGHSCMPSYPAKRVLPPVMLIAIQSYHINTCLLVIALNLCSLIQL